MGRVGGSNSNSGRNAKKRMRVISSSEDEANGHEERRRRGEPSKKRALACLGPQCRNCICRADLEIVREELNRTRRRLESMKEGAQKNTVKLEKMKKRLARSERTLREKERGITKLKSANSNLLREQQNSTNELEQVKKAQAFYEKEITRFQNIIEKREAEDKKRRKRKDATEDEPVPGSSKQGSSGGEGSESLFQDMLGNFKQLAENQLQCAICSEIIVQAVSTTCGHTFCTFCLGEWRKKKNNCPVCRTDIRSTAPCQMLDTFIGMLMEQFMPQSAADEWKAQKEERAAKLAAADREDDLEGQGDRSDSDSGSGSGFVESAFRGPWTIMFENNFSESSDSSFLPDFRNSSDNEYDDDDDGSNSDSRSRSSRSTSSSSSSSSSSSVGSPVVDEELSSASEETSDDDD